MCIRDRAFAEGADEEGPVRFTLKQLFNDPRRLGSYRLLLEATAGLPLDERQVACKRIQLALHIACELSRFSLLELPVVTRSTALSLVALTVEPAGVVTRVELRSVGSCVVHGQPILDGEHSMYEEQSEQNAGEWFRNDECRPQDMDKEFVKHVTEKFETKEEAKQLPQYHHSLAVDEFGIGMMCLQLLYGSVIDIKHRDALIQFWTDYKLPVSSSGRKSAHAEAPRQR